MDRESESAFRSHCIHTKNIFTLADLPKEDEVHQKIMKHINTCRACSTRHSQFLHETAAMKIFIPKPVIDREAKEIFERETSELFKLFNLNQKTAARNLLKNKIKAVDNVGAELIRTLSSTTMIKGYIFALVAFIVLKQYFN